MGRRVLFKFVIILLIAAFGLYAHIEKQNKITSIKMEIFDLAKEIDSIKEKNSRLMYDIEQFENPAHLLQLVKSPEFSHLKHPLVEEILSVREGMVFKNVDKGLGRNLKKDLSINAK